MTGNQGKQGKKGMVNKPRAIPAAYRPGWLQSIDGRYAPARAVSKALESLQDALGGASELSPQQCSLCERATWLSIRCQQMEQQYLAGEGLDSSEYVQLIGALNAVYRMLGINRRAKRVPRALEYADQVAAQTREVRKS